MDNRTGQVLHRLPFVLNGVFEVEEVGVDGTAAAWRSWGHRLAVELPYPLDPGEDAVVTFRYAGTVWVFGRRGTSRPGLVAGAWAQGALLPAGLGEGGHLEAERQARPYADAREEWRVRLPRDVYPEALRALCDHARRRGWEAVMARCADLYALVRQGELDLAAVPAATGGGW